MLKSTILIIVFLCFSCGKSVNETPAIGAINAAKNETPKIEGIVVGANQTEAYLPMLANKTIGVVANQTSVIFNDKGYKHLVDSLVSLKVHIKKVFAPEHGFRGTADAGEVVKDGVDTKTGIPIVSLYGKNKKPKQAQLEDLDLVIFDIQDVGARFYTYISSLHYVMEACAEMNIPLLVLDRPNPNGHYVDGPVLEIEHQSFVGMHPVPVVHGMTIGEYAKMINGEQWLAGGVRCDLSVIPVQHYWRERSYHLPIKPSPNLPNDIAINRYPSLCFFEGTNVSAGRGTEMQFQIFGSPFLNPEYYTFTFVPEPNFGSKYPKHKGMRCYGLNVTDTAPLNKIHLEWLTEAYQATADKREFFNTFFTKLAGTQRLQQQIEEGYTAYEIRNSWREALDTFKKLRAPYLIYP